MYLGLNNLGLNSQSNSFSPSNLFSASEPGFHAETYDPASLLTRRNMLTYSEGVKSTFTSSGSLITDSAIAGYDSALAFGWDGVNTQSAGKSGTISTNVGLGASGVFSVIVQMDDGGAPVPATGAAPTAAARDFSLVASNLNFDATVEALGGGLYRVWAAVRLPATVSVYVYKYSTNSNRTFKVTAWQFEPNVTTPSTYQKVTDWNTEYMAAALNSIGMWQDSAGTTPVTAVEQVVGLWVDTKRGTVVDSAPSLNGTFNTATWTKGAGWSAPSATSLVCDGSQGGASTDTTAAHTAAPTGGGFYRIQFTVSAVAGGAVSVYANNGANGKSVTTPGTYIVWAVINTATNSILIRAGANVTCTISSFTVDRVAGNHATQATSASRPTLSARVNLLTKTEQFDDAAWTKFEAAVSANTTATTDPLGGNTADKLVPTAVLASHGAEVTIGSSSTVFSVYAKKAEASLLMLFAVGENKGYGFDLNAGTTFAPGGITASSTFTMTDAGNGWYRCSITAATTTKVQIYVLNSTIYGSYSGNGVNGLYLWGADLRTTTDAALNQPAYQRVNTSTDYDTAGFIHYLKFDGTDDSFQTPSIDFSAGDCMTVWAGVTKLSDAAAAVLLESSATTAATDGSFAIFAPNSAAPDFKFRSRGTVFSDATAGGIAAPASKVLTGAADISADAVSLRVDGAVAATSITDQGSGNLTAQVLNIGRRNAVSSPFNGRLTSLTVRGTTTATDTSSVNRMEQYAAVKAGQTFVSA